MRAMKNYAGSRLSPWLGHLMVSRSETARPLLTPGEIMQLRPSDEIVMMSGVPPIRAKKARYYEDRRFVERLLPPPKEEPHDPRPDDWSKLPPRPPSADLVAALKAEDRANGDLRREPELPDHLAVARETIPSQPTRGEFTVVDDTPEQAARRANVLRQRMRDVARQGAMDPADGLDL
jgi:type IV secretion system protein VirD4